ncbi:MAG TPA: PrpF domain-containing protein [Terriglobia bacterium]|nr:PrpF domain-containing protein [Terriglobia bacterium]
MHDNRSQKIRAAIVRGGTSKGVFVFEEDLPRDPATRDATILKIFGSPDPRQINGLGGADPLTSKVAIIGKSSRPDADVNYTVGYVGINQAAVDYQGNCGNISIAVGPFAIDEGLVPAVEPITRVRIYNTNTNRILEAEVPVRNGRSVSEGDFTMDGIPGSGARIVVNFVNAAGSKTGRLLPTGRTVDMVELDDGRSVRCSMVDAATPAVFVQACDIGLTGTELPADTQTNPRILALMEEIRAKAAVLMKLSPSRGQVSPAVPKVGIVAAPCDYQTSTGKAIAAPDCDLVARTKALAVMHKAYAVTGGICLSTAAAIEGTVVYEIADRRAQQTGVVRIGHPSGVSSFLVSVSKTVSGEFELTKSATAGTARRIMDGYVYV